MKKQSGTKTNKKCVVNFYIDGFNIYCRISDYLKVTGVDYRWLDYRRVCEKVLRHGEVMGTIYFCTAIKGKELTKHSDKTSIGRHQVFVRALRARGVEVVKGTFKNDKEKQTDVNIAIRMVADALLERCDKCVLFSADSDFVPALRMVSALSDVQTMVMTPPYERGVVERRDMDDLTDAVGKRVYEVRFDSFAGCALPEEIQTNDGTPTIVKPAAYKIF